MKQIVLMGLCIQLVFGRCWENEVDVIKHCSYNQVCLPIKHCTIPERFAHEPASKSLTICNRVRIGKKVLKTSVCCPTTLNDKQCGINSEFPKPNVVVRRISHGEEAKPSQFPWMAQLLNKNRQFFCGGTLITKRFVLTAAHCVRKNNTISVRLGENQISQRTDFIHNGRKKNHAYAPLEIMVLQYIIHPRYKDRKKCNDIAVVQLEKEVSFSDSIRPICIPGRGKQELFSIPSQFLVVGGGLKENNEVSDVLQYGEVTSIPLKKCKSIIERSNAEVKLDDTFVCTTGSNQKNHRPGDSGGPLQFQSRLRYIQHGVVSFGIQPGAKWDNTGVYTRVDKFADWIHKVVHSQWQNANIKPLVDIGSRKLYKSHKNIMKPKKVITTFDFFG